MVYKKNLSVENMSLKKLNSIFVIGILAMDVSADLTELGRTPVAVVSAGIKSILDIGKTLEYLVRNSKILCCLT